VDVRQPIARQRIGYLPELTYYYKFLNAEELLRFYARIFGILEKAAARAAGGTADLSLLGNVEELLLLKALIQFPEEVAGAVAECNPSRVAVHVFNTAKAFNQFYNRHPVLQSGSDALTAARLELIRATAAVLQNGLALLGVEVLENM
jgi:arginyl-tRNA synthetase